MSMRNLSRKEEIEQASEEYYNKVKYLSDLSVFPIVAFKAGVEWADKTTIDKACEWLETHTFSELNLDFGYSLQIKEFVDRFKEYIKGE